MGLCSNYYYYYHYYYYKYYYHKIRDSGRNGGKSRQ